MKRIVKILLALFLFCASAGAIGAVALYMWATKDLPGFQKVTDFKPALVTTVYTRDGGVLGYFYREKRFLARMEDMPPYLPKAFLAAEDHSFYEHPGIDLLAITRAMFKNIAAGQFIQGGSTITQQVVKRLVLTSERSFERKIKEAILSYRLERYLSKDEILTIYMNQIYLGAKSYGVEAAARSYFGKHVGQLTLAESAILAGLPQAPSRYDPIHAPSSAKARQKYVLGRMLDQGWISREEHDKALAEKLVYKSMVDLSWKQGAYYLEEVRRWLIDAFSEPNMKAKGITLDRYGEDAVYESGLHVYTAVDMTHQVAAEKAMKDGLEAASKRHGWEGPLQKLTPEEFQAFLTREALPVELLAPGERLKALVTAVDKDGAWVKIGGHTGRISVTTMSWARVPNLRVPPEAAPAVKDATKVLEPGDVVLASILDAQAADPKKPKPASAKPDKPEPSARADKEPVLQLALELHPRIQGALVSLEPPNGEVRALVGGYAFEDSQFNRATQAYRQPGSSFKPIVYSAAMDSGFTAASIVVDAPIVRTFAGKTWKPENFDRKFLGPILLRTALVQSRNAVTVHVAERIGVDKIIQRAKALGLEPEFPYDLSIALGSVAVTPLNLCQAYTAFARGGSTVKPRLTLSVKSAWGEPLFESQPETKDAITPQNAYVMASLLKEVVQYGTGGAAKALGRPVGGKTGTSNDEHDAWFMGLAPYLLSGVWVGYDQPAPMGKFEVGGKAAAPIWVQYRKAVEANYPMQDFPEPPHIVHARVQGKGKGANPGDPESYFLPFMSGTEPKSGPTPEGGDPATKGEDLMKQMF